MEENMEKVLKLLSELRLDTIEIKNDIKNTNTNIAMKINPTLENHKRRLDNIERDQKRKNIIIHGLETEQRASYWSLETLILDFIRGMLEISLDAKDIDWIRKIKPLETKSPIIVSFVAQRTKALILINKNKLKNTKWVVEEDFPAKVLELRKTLLPQMRQARKEGKFAIIKYNKLIIKDRTTDNNVDSEEEFEGKEQEVGEDDQTEGRPNQETDEKQENKKRNRSNGSSTSNSPSSKKEKKQEISSQNKKERIWTQTTFPYTKNKNEDKISNRATPQQPTT